MLDYEDLMSASGPMVCGTPREAVEKLSRLHERFRHDLHIFHTDMGGMPCARPRRRWSSSPLRSLLP